jgi:cytochrome b
MTSHDKTKSLNVWDLPTRLFHWSLLFLIIACWWTSTENGDMDWHMRCGYAVLALLLFRLVWGVLGSTTARFSHFVAAPRAVLEYFSSMRKNRTIHHVGHNPAGGWMVLALLGMVLFISGSGLFANDDMMSEGPLAHHVSERFSDLATALHENGFHFMLALVGAHLAAIAFYLLVKKENLVLPMLTGIKHLPQDSKTSALHTQKAWLALLILGCTSGAVWALAMFA